MLEKFGAALDALPEGGNANRYGLDGDDEAMEGEDLEELADFDTAAGGEEDGTDGQGEAEFPSFTEGFEARFETLATAFADIQSVLGDALEQISDFNQRNPFGQGCGPFGRDLGFRDFRGGNGNR